MSQTCRVVVALLLLVDIQRGVITNSRSVSVVSHSTRDDDTVNRHSSAKRDLIDCRPPSSDTLWLRLHYRSPGPVELPASVDAVVDDTRSDGNNVDQRRQHAVRHGRRRSRGRRRRRQRLGAAASNSTSAADALETIRLQGDRRRSRRLDVRSSSSSSEDRPPTRSPTAWQCGLEKYWQRTRSGVFPSYVQTGRCTTPTCMMGLYECRERRYAVSVLKRRRGRCVPLPLTGVNSTTPVEELWVPSHYHVVVACECSARRATGLFPAGSSSSPP